jgi:hypothetical protein
MADMRSSAVGAGTAFAPDTQPASFRWIANFSAPNVPSMAETFARSNRTRRCSRKASASFERSSTIELDTVKTCVSRRAYTVFPSERVAPRSTAVETTPLPCPDVSTAR